jgi:hypothetical protein
MKQEEEYKKLVNVNKVAKAVKDIGQFALYSPTKDTNLLLTSSFILNLTEEQAWEVQCKLLAKVRGIWLRINKGELIEGNPVTEAEADIYFKAVNNSNLQQIGNTDLYLGGVALYAAESGYVGVQRKYIDMIGMPPLKKSPGSNNLIADDVHLIAPVKEVKSDYLAPLLF